MFKSFLKNIILFLFFFFSLFLFFHEISSYYEPVDSVINVESVTKNKISFLCLENHLILYQVDGNYEINNQVYETSFVTPYKYDIGSIKRIQVDRDNYYNILWYEEMYIYSFSLFLSTFLLILNSLCKPKNKKEA